MRQLLAEATLLALVGGGMGVLIGFWGMRILISVAPMEWIRSVSLSLDLRVLAFTLGVSVVTGILFGLVPAFRTSKADLHESLKRLAGNPRVSRVSADKAFCWSPRLLSPSCCSWARVS